MSGAEAPDAPVLFETASQKTAEAPNRNLKTEAREVLAFLNTKTGRNYQPVDANLKLILARLKTATVQDCKSVIAKKCREWEKKEKMVEYLRPATLFNATKFAQYQGELAVVPDQGGMNA